MAALRILLVDDHRVIADSLARLLQDDPAIQVVGIAATGPEAISLARLLRPSLVVMDIGLPGMDGVEATWTIRRQCPDVPVLMLTMFEQDAFAIDALRAGAAGYLLKTATPAELFHAIHAVCEGNGLVYPRTATAALQRAVPPRSRVQDPGALSRRDRPATHAESTHHPQPSQGRLPEAGRAWPRRGRRLRGAKRPDKGVTTGLGIGNCGDSGEVKPSGNY